MSQREIAGPIPRRKALLLISAAVTAGMMDPGAALAQLGGGGNETNPIKPEQPEVDYNLPPLEFVTRYSGKNPETETRAEANIRSLFESAKDYPEINYSAVRLAKMMSKQPDPYQNTTDNFRLIMSFGKHGQYGFAQVGVAAAESDSGKKKPLEVIQDVKKVINEGIEKPLLTHMIVISPNQFDKNNLGRWVETVLYPLNLIEVSNQMVMDRLVERNGMTYLELDNEISDENSEFKAAIRGNVWRKTLDSVTSILNSNYGLQMPPEFAAFYHGYTQKAEEGNEAATLKYLSDYKF